jgi:hypothetical protein
VAAYIEKHGVTTAQIEAMLRESEENLQKIQIIADEQDARL